MFSLPLASFLGVQQSVTCKWLSKFCRSSSSSPPPPSSSSSITTIAKTLSSQGFRSRHLLQSQYNNPEVSSMGNLGSSFLQDSIS
jgi:hypothetical protein